MGGSCLAARVFIFIISVGSDGGEALLFLECSAAILSNIANSVPIIKTSY